MASKKDLAPVLFSGTAEQIKEAENALVTGTIESVEALDKMAEQYLSLTVGDIKDLAGYNFIVQTEKDVKKISTRVEDMRTALNRPALDYQKAVNDKAKEIQAKLDPVKTHLATQKKTFEDATAAEAQRVFNERLAALSENGYDIISGQYVCGVVVLSPDQIKKLTQDEFNFHIEIGKKEVERKAAADNALTERMRALEEKERELAEREAKANEKEAELNAQAAALDQTYGTVEETGTVADPEPEPAAVQEESAMAMAHDDTAEDDEVATADPEQFGFHSFEGPGEEHDEDCPTENDMALYHAGFEAYRKRLIEMVDSDFKFNRAGLREWALNQNADEQTPEA